MITQKNSWGPQQWDLLQDVPLLQLRHPLQATALLLAPHDQFTQQVLLQTLSLAAASLWRLGSIRMMQGLLLPNTKPVPGNWEMRSGKSPLS